MSKAEQIIREHIQALEFKRQNILDYEMALVDAGCNIPADEQKRIDKQWNEYTRIQYELKEILREIEEQL